MHLVRKRLRRRCALLFSALFLAAALPGALAQAPDEGLKARTLYYSSGSDSDAKPAPKHTAAGKPKTATPPPAAAAGAASTVSPSVSPGVTPSATLNTTPDTKDSGEAAKVTPPATVTHLGVRYNVMLINTQSNEERLVDPDNKFEPNDCLALRVQSNYEGYLYVINHGSSGKWDVMLPSGEMPEEGNFVGARTALRIPAQYCFNIEKGSGAEDLYLIFSRNPQDVNSLNTAIKSQAAAPPSGGPVPAGGVGPAHSVGTEIARLEQLQSRDLTVKKVAKPMSAQEPPNSVYVVNVSDTPSDRIISQIQIKH
jgi:Domain of unknown function (DUF4384)